MARDWVRPSEGFVADVVGASRLTCPTVAFGTRHDYPTPDVPAYDLGWLARRSDKALRGGLALVAARRRTQVLHAHFGYWAHHVEAVARRTRRPWGVSLHGQDLLVEGVPMAARADLVVVPSAFLADAASERGVPDEVLQVIASGLDLTRFAFRERHSSEAPVLVTFAGRYVEKKGVLDAARALAGLPVRARFVGHGPLEGELRALLLELDLDAELVDGSVPGAVHRALDETDLLLTPSKVAADGDAETLGLVNLEALACGVPVVTTSSGGIPEAMGDAALLVAEGDVGALRGAVASLCEHPERWPEVGRHGRAHVEREFSLPDRVGELEEQWLRLARDARR